jgi:hypothetical protein
MRIHAVHFFVDLLFLGLLIDLGCKLKLNQSSSTENEFVYFKYYVPKSIVSNDPYGYFFEAPRILKSIRHKKFISVALTADQIEDEKRLSFIRSEARRLNYTNDTNVIIKVFIPDSSKYGTFLNLLYIMNEDQHKRYFEYQNRFYIFGEAPFKEVKTVKEIPTIEL